MMMKRNYGIDVLRILAMIGIVIFHLIGHGGVLSALDDVKSSGCIGGGYFPVWFLTVITYCSVDIYAIISGFVGYREESNIQYRIDKYGKLWVQVVFYSVVISIVMRVFFPGEISISDCLQSVFPVTFNRYWYFSAYTGLFFLIPHLNRMIQRLDNKELSSLFAIGVIVFSCFGGIFAKYHDPFTLKNGSSFVWIMFLYCFGAFARKTDLQNKIPAKRTVIFASLLLCLAIASSLAIPEITNLITGHRIGRGILLSYSSPLVLLLSEVVVLLFAKIDNNCRLRKLIITLSSSTFGVYLIHDHPLIRQFLIGGFFSELVVKINMKYIAFAIIFVALVIFALCAIIEIVRSKIMRCIRIPLSIISFVNSETENILNWFAKLQ